MLAIQIGCHFVIQQENLSALATERELFEERLKQFSHSYDLHGSGLKHREEEDKKTIATLQDELLLLETGSIAMVSCITGTIVMVIQSWWRLKAILRM